MRLGAGLGETDIGKVPSDRGASNTDAYNLSPTYSTESPVLFESNFSFSAAADIVQVQLTDANIRRNRR